MSSHSRAIVTMSREKTSQPDQAKALECPQCGGPIPVGGWPWCKGNPSEHLR